MCTGSVGGRVANNVTPFGGRARRLGTNPIAMAFPSAGGRVALLDFATSIAAEGKLRVYRAKGETLPDDWVLDRDGAPSRDPNAYYEGGSLLPIGGLHGGHKGYALSFMVAMLGAVMGSAARPAATIPDQVTGSTIIVMDLAGMGPIDDIRATVGDVVDYVKDTPLAEGSTGIPLPRRVRGADPRGPAGERRLDRRRDVGRGVRADRPGSGWPGSWPRSRRALRTDGRRERRRQRL